MFARKIAKKISDISGHMANIEVLIKELRKVLAPDQILLGEALQNRYDHIWSMDVSTLAAAAFLPRNTSEVAAILAACYHHDQPIVVHGGLTNLVGSTVAGAQEMIISLEKMNAIEEVDESSRSITLQAGVILEAAQEAAAEKDMLLPLSFGAKGSAQMGGVIASNAGGMRVVRFGMVRQMVLGLEVVLPNGQIISSLKKIIKDNSGYDLKQLFIGSEGTLGIVTRAVIKLIEAPSSRSCAILACAHYVDVVRLLKYLDQKLAGTLSAFELMWQNTYQALTSPPSNPRPPLTYDHPFYVLVEALGADPEADRARMILLLENALELGLASDAVPAQSESEIRWFWSIREEVEGMTSLCCNAQQFDISLPVAEIGPYVENILPKLYALTEVERVFSFGHVADGNVHFIVGKTDDSDALKHRINEIVYEPLQGSGGSISAEHGIGRDKKPYLPYARTEIELALMRQLRKTLNPKNNLNPGRILD